jgi:fluoroquinolone transport system permease protein
VINPATLALNDFRLLWRHGFAIAYLVVAVLYAAVLSAMPRTWADALLPVLAWSDPAFFCFFFAGASVCLDLDQGTFRALFASPLRPSVYLVVKAANLSILAFLMAAAISVSSRGAGFRLWPIAAAALAGGAPSAVLGASIALRLRTINRFMIGSMPFFLVLALPVAEYAGGRWLPSWFTVLSRLTPEDGALRFARAAYTNVPAGELALGAAMAVLWTITASVFALGPAVARARGD